jgi:type IV pilus biogenesis protein CpaD/CtpE
VLPLADPFVVLQSLAAGQIPHRTALIAAARLSATACARVPQLSPLRFDGLR